MAPLLNDLNRTLTALATEIASIAALVQPPVEELVELAAATRLLSLRAALVHHLYAATAPAVTAGERNTSLTAARAVLGVATGVVRAQEGAYRVPSARVGSWRATPTAYDRGYLWTVSSLFYWWRDYGQAERGSAEARHSPCYLNMQCTHGARMAPCQPLRRASPSRPHAQRHDSAMSRHLAPRRYPFDVAFGGKHVTEQVAARLREALRHLPVVRVELADCLAPPPVEYEFPRDLYRYG